MYSFSRFVYVLVPILLTFLLIQQGLEGRYAAMFNATAERFDLALFFITDDPALLAQLHVQVGGEGHYTTTTTTNNIC